MMAAFPGTKTARHPAARARGLIVIATLFCACKAGPIDIAGLSPKPNQDANPPPDSPADSPPNSLLNGVVAHWPLDDGVGTTAADRSGRGFNGTLKGGTWITSQRGLFGGALHFDVGDEISVPSFPQATDSSWSVSLWVRPPVGDFNVSYLTLISTENVFSGGWEMNLARMNPTTTPPDIFYQFGYYFGPGPPRTNDYYSYDCRCVVPPPQWTHIVGVVDMDSTAAIPTPTLSMYQNGVLQASPILITQPIKAGSDILYIGRWPDYLKLLGLRSFVGDLDDIVIYNRALTAPEVTKLYQAPAPDPH